MINKYIIRLINSALEETSQKSAKKTPKQRSETSLECGGRYQIETIPLT